MGKINYTTKQKREILSEFLSKYIDDVSVDILFNSLYKSIKPYLNKEAQKQIDEKVS